VHKQQLPSEATEQKFEVAVTIESSGQQKSTDENDANPSSKSKSPKAYFGSLTPTFQSSPRVLVGIQSLASNFLDFYEVAILF
jgi:hypothetical protein